MESIKHAPINFTKPAECIIRVEIYARRWEQELYYKELKLELRGVELLQSHTLETAMQELAAMVITSAIIARRRRCSPRTLRQPVVKWPRIQKAQSYEGDFIVQLLPLSMN